LFTPTAKEAEMTTTTTTTITLKTIEVVSKRIPRRGKKLGQMLVFNEDITEINGAPSSQFPTPSLGPPQHLGFCFRVQSQIWGSVKPDGPCRVFRPRVLSRTAVKFRLEDSSISAVTQPVKSLSLGAPMITCVL
jgi:hypothetical protein